MSGIIIRNINDLNLQLRQTDGYVNITMLAENNGKKISHYLGNESTKEFLQVLASDAGIPASQLLQVRKGNSKNFEQGTWAHPKLAMHFAQWCNPETALAVINFIYDWLGSTHVRNQRLKQLLLGVPQEWQKRFPEEFFIHAMRIHGYDYMANGKLSYSFVGKLINQCVYDPILFKLSDELKSKRKQFAKDNNSDESYFKLHQFLQENATKELERQIETITVFLRISNNSKHSYALFDAAFRDPDQLLLLFNKAI